MNVLPHTRAKGKSGGNLSLYHHTDHVLAAVLRIAEHLNLSEADKNLARAGAILHDMGKANPIFQDRLDRMRSPMEEPYRHELGSLFFLPLFSKEDWPVLIEMVVAHHRSIRKDAREQGILDLEDNYMNPAKDHLGAWEDWHLDGAKIMEAFGVPTRTISKEEALNAYNHAVEYCLRRQFGWSFWKGLLIAADHYASSLNEETFSNLNKSFQIPDLQFYFQNNRKSPLFPLSLKRVHNFKPHTLVTAPTGAGKTDFLMKRCKGRVFYTLPFQASINAMYQRFNDELGEQNEDIRILHASSRLTIDKGKIEERALQDKAGASIKVLTPYQLASIAFATKGYEAILVDIQGCDVILDEIHTYSSYSQAIVLKVVEVLAHFDCRLHIGTATMPSKLKQHLIGLLGKDQVYEVQLSPEELDEFDRHTIHKLKESDDVLQLIEEAYGAGEKVLVVVNQVAQAQKFYQELKETYPEFRKMLLHSRFKRKDRADLEKRLKAEFDNQSEPCVVVSTQVVEVSLDISFDRMITEAAPLDALIQRFGRINRRRKARDKRELKPVHILPPPEDEKEVLPYEADLVRQSFAALPDGGALHERQIQALLDDVFGELELKTIELSATFKNGQFTIRELWHQPKSALIEQMDIETTACITQADWEAYLESDADERVKLEIPVRYKSVAYRKLDQEKRKGNRPFIIPNVAYEDELGLLIKNAEPANYKTFELI